MKAEVIAAVIMCILSCGGVLIYIGRSLGTLQSIGEGVKVALAKTDRHDEEIKELAVAVVEVRTRQADCAKCP